VAIFPALVCENEVAVAPETWSYLFSILVEMDVPFIYGHSVCGVLQPDQKIQSVFDNAFFQYRSSCLLS
jgi:hypothetical protein